MTTLLKQLEELAIITYDDCITELPVTSFDKQKFARLIVDECISQMCDGPEGPARLAKVMKHFGFKD